MPKTVNRQEMQNAILDAAMRVFSEMGYHTATIADVAKAANLGKGTLYLYFQNKEALGTSMVERHFESLEKRLMQTDTPETIGAFVNSVAQAATISKEHAEFIGVFFEICGPSFASKEFTAAIADFFNRLGSHYAKQVAYLQSSGQVREDLNSEVFGRSLASVLDGMILHKGLFSIPEARYRAMCDAMIDMLIRGLIVKQPGDEKPAPQIRQKLFTQN